jgi:hypothetical protein
MTLARMLIGLTMVAGSPRVRDPVAITFPAFSPAHLPMSSQNQLRIPRTFIQTTPNRTMHKSLASVVASLQRVNPSYSHRIMLDSEQVSFMNSPGAATLVDGCVPRAYSKITKGAMKADLFRLAYLALHGGVYLDIDVMALTPLDKILSVLDDMVLWLVPKPEHVIQWVMLAVPKHPVILQALKRACRNVLTGHRDVSKKYPEKGDAGIAGPVVVGLAAIDLVGPHRCGRLPLSNASGAYTLTLLRWGVKGYSKDVTTQCAAHENASKPFKHGFYRLHLHRSVVGIPKWQNGKVRSLAS